MPVLTPFLDRFPRGRAAFLVALLLLGWVPSSVRSEISREYQVKATFLFNLTQFVKWPPAAFSGPEAPFTIGILGDDPFGPFLDATVKGEKVDGHPLMVKRFGNVVEAKDCQMLFISPSEMGHLREILGALKGRKILTVGDKEGFVRGGGVVRFVTEKNKVHLRIGLEAAKEADLTISSQLLRLSEIGKREVN